MKSNEYIIERMRDGTWTLAYRPDCRVLVFDAQAEAWQKMLDGAAKDFPSGTRFRVFVETEAGEPAPAPGAW